MNILLLTHMYPYPPNDGGRIVTFNSIKHDVKCGNAVTVITFNDSKVKSELDEFCETRIIEKDTNNNYIKMLLNLFSLMPYNMSKYYDSRVCKEIDEVLKGKDIDLVIIDHLHMAIYGKYIRKTYSNIPIILRQHNVESTIMERFYKNQNNPLVKAYAWLQYKKLYNYEKDIVGIYDKCFMITDEDTKRIVEMNSNVNATTIPAGVDIERYSPVDVDSKENSIVFLGAMNWMPNEDGVLWFIESIFNKILVKIPTAKLYVVGKNPTDKIKSLDNKLNVIVTGFVEDDRDYISKAKVFIVPLRIGGGMRIKILNAMSMGKCVLSTSIGAEGIDVSGKDIVISDTEDNFAEKIIELINDDSKRREIEKNARKTIIDKYSWESICAKANNEYRKLVGEINE